MKILIEFRKPAQILLLIGVLGLSNPAYTQENTPRNSIMIESNIIAVTSLSYDRIVPLKEYAALLFGGSYLMGTGFGHGSHWLGVKSGVLAFGPKHFLETGIQYVFALTDDDSSFGVQLAYRFVSKKGLSFRAATNLLFNFDPIFIPTLGIGYTF